MTMTTRMTTPDRLDARQERALLARLDRLKSQLARALATIEGPDAPLRKNPVRRVERLRARGRASGAALESTYRRYAELRGRLALAHMGFVGSIARGFRRRGVCRADLLQEGFCALLSSIDQFDLAHETPLATYAKSAIRQAMQSAAAAGAYPVRLAPEHLARLARSEAPRTPLRDGELALVRQIRAAIRPGVALDTVSANGRFDRADGAEPAEREVDARDEAETAARSVAALMGALSPRERRVLALRFGLGGGEPLPLSGVGAVLGVTRERVRQIQDKALDRLRQAKATRLDRPCALRA